MASSRLATAIRATLLFAAGGAAAAAWGAGLYANMTLALLLGAWVFVTMIGEPATVAALPAPPPPLPDDARERRRLAAYLNLTPAPLVTLDSGHRLHAANHAARRLFGTDDLIADPGEALVEAIGTTAPGRSMTVALDAGGAAHSFALATADLAIEGTATRIAVLVDIDAELRAAEATALRDLLQILGHEIRNTLTPIASLGRTAAEMLADPAPDLPEIQDAVATIARRAEGLQRFSEGYAELARLPAPNVERIELARLVADIERLFAARWPAIGLVCDAEAAPATLDADAGQLTAALWAILQNAAEATSAQPEPLVSLTIRATIEGTAFEIADNGPGIAAANRDAIFRPFFTTKAAGSGIGLALARQIFRSHGGALDLAAEQTDGTTFLAMIGRTRS